MTATVAVLDREEQASAYPSEQHDKRWVRGDAPARQASAHPPVCSACRTIIQTDKATFVFQDAAFCEDCWHDLPISERDQVVREIALRGVPLS